MQWSPDDLQSISGLLPYTAQVLIGCIGPEATARLLSARPGCSIQIPRHPDANAAGARRWAELAEIIGEHEMRLLATRWGGDIIDIPTCKAARDELRARSIRAMYDQLTMRDGYSGNQAIYEICLRFAPISSRAVELIIGRTDTGTAAQVELF